MKWRTAIVWICLFAALAVTGSLIEFGSRDQVKSSSQMSALVTRVVDGDTIRVKVDGKQETVRYIGVDTPETKKPDTPVQCYGPAASHLNHQLVDGERVRLQFDRETRDRYGRLLAYVYRQRDGLLVNAALLRGGYARTLTIPPNTAQAARFSRIAATAGRRNRGLWGAC